jgi:hypothetical protein
MRSQKSLWAQIFVGGTWVLVGAVFCVAGVFPPSQEPDVTVSRPLRPRSAPPEEQPLDPLTRTVVGLFIAVAGTALVLSGWHRLSFQEDLLKRGIPVEGRITRIVKGDSDTESEARYSFEDRQGELREGIYRYSEPVWSDTPFTEDQEVTVVYDPDDSRKHVLDLKNPRRARNTRRR